MHGRVQTHTHMHKLLVDTHTLSSWIGSLQYLYSISLVPVCLCMLIWRPIKWLPQEWLWPRSGPNSASELPVVEGLLPILKVMIHRTTFWAMLPGNVVQWCCFGHFPDEIGQQFFILKSLVISGQLHPIRTLGTSHVTAQQHCSKSCPVYHQLNWGFVDLMVMILLCCIGTPGRHPSG